MAEEIVTPPAPSPAPAPAPAPTPAPAPAPSASIDEVPKTWEDIFKHPRFEQLNQQAKDAKAALDKRAQDDAAAEEARQIAAGEHQKVIDSLKPQAARAVELESALKTVVDAEIATIPKERQSLVPDLPLEKKLLWINANRAILMGDKKPSVNHPLNPVDGAPEGENNQTFTQAQIKDPVFYEKHKDAIMQALRDGRITD